MREFLATAALVMCSVLIGCSSGEQNEIAIRSSERSGPIPTMGTTSYDLPSDEQFDKWIEDSFQPVIEKWLRNEPLPAFVELDRKDEWAANSERQARVELIDVNGDGYKELAMQTGCAVVGNCVLYLFQKTSGGHKAILVADTVQRFKLRRNRTNEYYDLETSAHGSSTSGGIAVHKFDGTEYKIAECFGYEYERTGRFDRKGQPITRDRPTLTPWNCENWPAP